MRLSSLQSSYKLFLFCYMSSNAVEVHVTLRMAGYLRCDNGTIHIYSKFLNYDFTKPLERQDTIEMALKKYVVI
jgi:hypothetical protein